MRKVLTGRRLLPLLLGLALLLSACTPQAAEPTPTLEPTPSPTPAPVPAVFALACYPSDSFHPITGTNRTNLLLAPLVYEGLFSLDGTFTPQNQLCASYTVSEDGLTWTFTLAEDTFSDGSPLTAQDVASSLTLAMGEGSLYAQRLTGVQSVSVRSDTEVEVTLRAPNGALPALLDIPVVRSAGEGLPPLGTGDYAFAQDGEDWLLRRISPLPSGSSAPEEIPLRSIRQTDDLIYAFDAQDISLVSTDLTGTNSLGFSGSLETWDYATSVLLYLAFNTDSGPCADQAVRRALSYGFDRASVVVSLLSRHAQEAALPVSPASPLYDQDLADSLAFSYQSMEEGLDQAGWTLTDGVRTQGRRALSLTFLVNTENAAKVSIARHLAQGLERSGITVDLQELTWEDYTAALSSGDFDLYLGEVRLTADFDLSPLLSRSGALNYGRWEDEETETLLAAFRAASGEGRADAATALYARLAEAAPLVPLCFKNWSVLTHWGQLAGLTPTAQNIFSGFDGWTF